MIASFLLPLAIGLIEPAPVPSEQPQENRTKIALEYAAQYIDVGANVSTAAFGGGESCTLVRPVGFGFCLFECEGKLTLLECPA